MEITIALVKKPTVDDVDGIIKISVTDTGIGISEKD